VRSRTTIRNDTIKDCNLASNGSRDLTPFFRHEFRNTLREALGYLFVLKQIAENPTPTMRSPVHGAKKAKLGKSLLTTPSDAHRPNC
jgi:hypothetical protein